MTRDLEIFKGKNAPLGEVFLYQGMLLAEMEFQPVTIAITLLGAGAALNLLLAKALKLPQDVLSK